MKEIFKNSKNYLLNEKMKQISIRKLVEKNLQLF